MSDDTWMRKRLPDSEIVRSDGPTMTAAEAVMLCRYAAACCPAQKIDEYTPDAWHDLLNDLRFDDCKAGIAAVAKRQSFVSPAEIRDAVRALRHKRLDEFMRAYPISPPAEVIDGDYDLWERTWRRRVMDGDITHPTQIEGARDPASLPKPTRTGAEVIAEAKRLAAEARAAHEAANPEPTYTPAPRLREPEPAGDRPTDEESVA